MRCEEKSGNYCMQAIKYNKYAKVRSCDKCCIECVDICIHLCDKAKDRGND